MWGEEIPPTWRSSQKEVRPPWKVSRKRGKKPLGLRGKGGGGITSQGALQIGGKGIQKGGTGIIEHDRIL